MPVIEDQVPAVAVPDVHEKKGAIGAVLDMYPLPHVIDVLELSVVCGAPVHMPCGSLGAVVTPQ